MILLLADENLPKTSYLYLVDKGYDVKYVLLESAGISDVEVVGIAIEEDRIIITFDSDFGELVFRAGFKPKGAIYFRWSDFRPSEPGMFLDRLISQQKIVFEGFFTVIDRHQIRQRKI